MKDFERPGFTEKDIKDRIRYPLRSRFSYEERIKGYIGTTRTKAFLQDLPKKTMPVTLEEHKILKKYLNPIYDYLKLIFEEGKR